MPTGNAAIALRHSSKSLQKYDNWIQSENIGARIAAALGPQRKLRFLNVALSHSFNNAQHASSLATFAALAPFSLQHLLPISPRY
jgi:hypothetical protein